MLGRVWEVGVVYNSDISVFQYSDCDSNEQPWLRIAGLVERTKILGVSKLGLSYQVCQKLFFGQLPLYASVFEKTISQVFLN